MSFPRCPRCGKSREGMNDQQECWNCGYIPAKAPPPINNVVPPPPPAPLPDEGPLETVPPMARWIMVSGTIGILLLLVTLIWGVRLFIHARNFDEGDEENTALVQQRESETLPTASPTTQTDPGIVPPTATNPVAIDPFDQTATALQPTATPTNNLPPTPTETPTTPTPVVCPDAPPARLQLNQQASVISRNGINMRDAPSTQGNIVLNVSFGDSVTIIGGPECAESYLWWQVRLADNREGWMAEGTTAQYFLEPR